VELIGSKLVPGLPMDGSSLMPHLYGVDGGHDTVFAEYMGEGTAAPLMMIRRGDWKYITCPIDPPQLFNLRTDPHERENLANSEDIRTQAVFKAFELEASKKWDFKKITDEVLKCQRQRRLVWSALSKGRFESWDWNPIDDGRVKYIRSQTPLDELERKARYPMHTNIPAQITVNKKAEAVVLQPKRLTELASEPVHYR
jgi:hypothetical protein